MTRSSRRRAQEEGEEPKKDEDEKQEEVKEADEEEKEADNEEKEADNEEKQENMQGEEEEEEEQVGEKENKNPSKKRRTEEHDEEDDEEDFQEEPVDPEVQKALELIESSEKKSELENVMYDMLKRREAQVDRLSAEVIKLKNFISKRKQTYKRKRKDEGAPTRALSAYNIFVQDRFAKLSKENEQALKSSDLDAKLKRVPPSSLVASTGNEWKELSAEDKSHYEERAREDRKRYEEQMAKYQPPDKQANRKRNKTGYNMFFSAHVLRLKQSESGVPSERGSVARLVGNAWKQLSAEEKQYYEREADKMNGMNPVGDKDDEDEDGDVADKRPLPGEYPSTYPVQHGDMHMHGMPPPMHDPRYAYPPSYAYGQPPYHAYHDQPAQHRHYQGRHAGHYQYPPHPYDQRGMGM